MIDASHPYAEVVSRNIMNACEAAGVLLSRYQRPEQLSGLTHPQLYTVQSIPQACEVARRFGDRVLLTTGSKIWPRREGLPEKTLLARVLLYLRSFSNARIWDLASVKSSHCVGRLAPSSTPRFIASVRLMW